jgi:hypothetical protein
MPDARCRLEQDDVVIGLDLVSTRSSFFRLTVGVDAVQSLHSKAGVEELLRWTAPAALGRWEGHRVFAFEATATCGRRSPTCFGRR